MLSACFLIWCLVQMGYLDNTFGQEELCLDKNQFEYQYNVVQQLVRLEEQIQTLQQSYQVAMETNERIINELHSTKMSSNGSSYIRWGRTVCPEGAMLVYQGYGAGGHYTNSGDGANRICLTNTPTWNEYVEGAQSGNAYIYGMEYQLSGFGPLSSMNEQDVPCSVCRIPRSDNIMIPGTNECPPNYRVEYTGYLMGGHYSHTSASEYICLDDAPESVKGGATDNNGALLYAVQASCGALKCPPYKHGRELTCVVCSYAPTQNVFNPV